MYTILFIYFVFLLEFYDKMNILQKNTYFLFEQMAKKRHKAKLTQKQVASMIGSSQATIATLEKAHRNATLDYFVKWANALGYMVTLVRKDDLLD